MKAVVIGAGGFVGQEVVRQMLARQDVEKLTLLDVAEFGFPADPRVTAICGDLGDAAVRHSVLEGADKVIFLASILGGAAEAHYKLARKVNVDATLDVFEHLRETAPQTRMVFASTIAVYAKPMPDPVTDATGFGPTMVYGAQKLMMEVALSNFAARGWLDGVSLRPAGVMARDGADASLKSGFMSRLFWCVKRGEDITLPVGADNRTWLTSVSNVAANFIHAATLPDLGPNRAFTLPALSLTFGELVAALRRRYPDSPSRISFAPDAEICALFGSYPRLETGVADALAFTRDADADDLVNNAMPKEILE